MGGARIIDVAAMWEQNRRLGAKENRCWSTFKNKETKIPMTKASKEFIIYIYLQHTPLPIYLIATLPLGLLN